MLKIRLRRVGRKNEPHYQIVVTPHTSPVKSHYHAKLGWFNPKTKEVKVDKEAVLDWLNKGAQPSNRVAKLLIEQKIAHKAIKFVPNAPRAPKKAQKEADKAVKTPVTAEKAAEVTTDEIPPVEEPKAEETKTEDSNEEAAEPEKAAEAPEAPEKS